MADTFSVNSLVAVAPQWVNRSQIKAAFGISAKTIEDAYRNGAPIERRYSGTVPLYSVASINSWIDSLPQDR